jgi:hypothetical protein
VLGSEVTHNKFKVKRARKTRCVRPGKHHNLSNCNNENRTIGRECNAINGNVAVRL